MTASVSQPRSRSALSSSPVPGSASTYPDGIRLTAAHSARSRTSCSCQALPRRSAATRETGWCQPRLDSRRPSQMTWHGNRTGRILAAQGRSPLLPTAHRGRVFPQSSGHMGRLPLPPYHSTDLKAAIRVPPSAPRSAADARAKERAILPALLGIAHLGAGAGSLTAQVRVDRGPGEQRARGRRRPFRS